MIALLLSRVSEEAGTWDTAAKIAGRAGVSPLAVGRCLEWLGAQKAQPDPAMPPRFMVEQRISAGRAAELVIGAHWAEVRSGEREGGPSEGGAWVHANGVSWLREIEAEAAGFAIRWDGTTAHLSALPEWECSAVELLDFLATGGAPG